MTVPTQDVSANSATCRGLLSSAYVIRMNEAMSSSTVGAIATTSCNHIKNKIWRIDPTNLGIFEVLLSATIGETLETVTSTMSAQWLMRAMMIMVI